MVPAQSPVISTTKLPSPSSEPALPLPIMSPLLRLPRELRNLIYDYYLHCDGGYIYDWETRKLLQADGSAVSYALAFTCR